MSAVEERQKLSDPVELIGDLVKRRLATRLDSPFDSRELRLSEVGACPRFRAAKAAGRVDAAALAPDLWDAGYFERGRIAERWVADLFRQAFPRRCRHEVEVRHPWGVGHIDLWFPAERLVVEIKSATVGSDGTFPQLPRDSHLLQVQAYLHYFRGADGERRTDRALLLYVLLGHRVDFRAYPLRYSPAIGARIEAELAEIARHAERGTLPPVPEGYSPFAFPCAWSSPRGERGRCPLFDLCWGGRADAEEATRAEGELRRLIDEYADLHRRKKAAEQQAALLEGMLDDLRPRLDAAFTAMGVRKAATDAAVITRSEVRGRRRVNLDAAVKAGAVDEQALAPFVEVGEPSVRWLVRLAGEGAEGGDA